MQLSIQFSVCFLTTLASVVRAQTPDGFEPGVSETLAVSFGSTVVSPAGVTLPREVTQSLPSIAATGDLSGTYIFMVVDLDVPQRNGDVINSTAPRVQLLHALIPNYRSSSNGTLTSPDTANAPAPYRGPAPPAENPPVPHRYVELLFEQPENFAIPDSQKELVQTRRGFNTTEFVAAASLDAPIRGNYFQVVNNSAVALPTGTGGGMPTPTDAGPPSTFTGAAETLVGSAAGAIVAFGAALLAL